MQPKADHCAIVRQMIDHDAAVNSFFARYESANTIFDINQIANCYAEFFMFGGPDGVRCVKKEDFVKMLPKRKDFFRSRGLAASSVDSLEAVALDARYSFVKVIWKMQFARGAAQPVYSQNAASYVLSRANDGFQIVFQIDHQDLTKRADELGF